MHRQNTKIIYHSKWDAIGISASLLCAIHCVLLPIFFATLPFLGMEILENPALEITTVLLSFGAGSWALYHGYCKYHKGWIFILFVAGIILLILSNVIPVGRPTEIVLKSMAAANIITAHIFNIKYSKYTLTCQREKKQTTSVLNEINC